MEKIKINLSKKTLNNLLNDMATFEYYKKNGEINKNGFLEKWSSGTLFIPIIMIISFILFNVSFKIIVGKKIKK